MANVTDRIQFSDFESINPETFEVYLDIDLDQLTVLFFGRDRRFSVNPRNPVLSVLEDPTTNEVIGISLDRFMKQVLQEHPSMIGLASVATILVGDELIPPGEFYRHPLATSTKDRLDGEIPGARHTWNRSNNRDSEVHNIYNTILQFA